MHSVRLCLSINGKARDHKCTQCDYVILSINKKVRDHKCTKCDYFFLSLTMLETINTLNMITFLDQEQVLRPQVYIV
jgi:hypothetical protein